MRLDINFIQDMRTTGNLLVNPPKLEYFMKRRAFIKSMIFHSGMLAFGSYNLSAAPPNAIKILMVYNNAGGKGDYIKRWGLSTWIEQNNDAVLFDTGKKPKVLWKNILQAGIDIQKLSKIVISHNHRDHIDGLPILLKKLKSSPKVLVPHSDLEKIRSKYPQADISGIKEIGRASCRERV